MTTSHDSSDPLELVRIHNDPGPKTIGTGTGTGNAHHSSRFSHEYVASRVHSARSPNQNIARHLARPLRDTRSPEAQTASEVGSSLNFALQKSSIKDKPDDQSSQLSTLGSARLLSNKRGTVDEAPDSRPAKRVPSSRRISSRKDSFQNSPIVVPTSPLSSPTSRVPVVTTNRLPPDPNVTPSLPSPDGSTLQEFKLLKEPTTRPISEQQLINEVKGIYAGLVMVEKKCVEIVAQQSQSTKRLEPQQWKALVALHRTLLQEHHDFFSASQHPTASEPLKRLAVKYAMPARMWRHGIHAFLELLRHRLPESMEHMLSFIYLAYSMMALLKESVPSFIETWIECLGDLARYRMAIEDSDPRDREIWSNVARMWYNEAADKSPTVGRIQHHLAVLSRPNVVEQGFHYTKALTCVIPFVNARESIMLLYDMPLKSPDTMQARYPPAEYSLVALSAVLFTKGSIASFHTYRQLFADSLSQHIDRQGSKLKVQGPQIILVIVAMLLDFGRENSQLWLIAQAQANTIDVRKQALEAQSKLTPNAEAEIRTALQREAYEKLTAESKVNRVLPPPAIGTKGNIQTSEDIVALAGLVLTDAISVPASRIGDKNIVPMMHTVLANLWGLSFVRGALTYVEVHVPWLSIVTFLNTVGRSGVSYCNIEAETFPPSTGGLGRQLPEDFANRGYITTQYYYPVDFFTEQLVDEDDRNVELPSHQAPRTERCLWLGVRIASLGRWLSYSYESKRFAATEFAESLSVMASDSRHADEVSYSSEIKAESQ